MVADALIGYSGFVGTTLLRQNPGFTALFRSTNIQEIQGREFDTVVCAGAPAQKWLANRDPVGDRSKIDGLIGHLSTIRCRQFILISTVDVFQEPDGVDEMSPVPEDDLHAYGRHRRLLEKFVEAQFARHLVVRLPGLVGPGLRKNVIYDFLNDNNLQAIDSRGVFQFYPMVNLWPDIQTALEAELSCVHLTAHPLSVLEIARIGFGLDFVQPRDGKPARYDVQTRHAACFGASGRHQYDVRHTLLAIRAYAQSEPKAVRSTT